MKMSVITPITLVNDVRSYLHDAGFSNKLYKINDFNNMYQYVEVDFVCDDAIDFIMEDVMKSDYSELLEIKKYQHGDDIYTAIFTYLD